MSEMTLVEAKGIIEWPMLCGNEACSCGRNLMQASRLVLAELSRLEHELASAKAEREKA